VAEFYLRLEVSTAFTAPTFAIVSVAQRCYAEISYIQSHTNRPTSIGSTGRSQFTTVSNV
jgi:hypothetical protein